jgi:TonB family protein
VLQQEIETHFPALQEAYEKERATDSSLIGSLVLDFTIDGDGQTSQIDLQSAKIGSAHFQQVVQELVRQWQFSPASGAVRLEYPLLFLPPGLDAASIMAWEKRTAALEVGQSHTEETQPVPPYAGNQLLQVRGEKSCCDTGFPL